MSAVLIYIEIPAPQYRSTLLEKPKQNGAVDYRMVIHFLHLKGNNAAIIHSELVEVYSNKASSYDTVVRRRRYFQCGKTSLNDEKRSGRPSLCAEPRIARDVEALVLEDRRITIEAIVEKSENQS
ncbi:hypothetical protein ANN_24548 [Periplaneta americana]|uniref:Uncharacterized protein n=1 Tax=Periplaneta americana TaxID=6978 RepID=A0ABQ8S3P7_PERAM|nr:hypothetical protein ANN_24548 [Periplaneta americana]